MILANRRNLGPRIVQRLEASGVGDLATLRRLGPAAVYRRLVAASDRPPPVCYYLYSLEGALRDCDWRSLSDDEKVALRSAAGLP